MKILRLVFVFLLFVDCLEAHSLHLEPDTVFYSLTDTLNLQQVKHKSVDNSCKSFYKYRASKADQTSKFQKRKDQNVCAFNDGFMIKSKLLIGNHLSGSIIYQVNVIEEENTYVLALVDPVFIPYERDRYGKFVPVSGKKIPLEKLRYSSYSANLVENIQSAYQEYVVNYMNELKIHLMQEL